MLHHIALTGVPGIGKTTLVQRIVSGLNEKGIECAGFITEEVRDKGKRIGFDVITLDGKRGILSRINPSSSFAGKGQKLCCVGQYVVDVKAFESLTLPLLSKEKPMKSVIVIDEIGKMEMFSTEFISKVETLLKNPTQPLLVTIPVPKGKPISLIERIRNHKNVTVKVITKANRDDQALYEEIVQCLTKQIL